VVQVATANGPENLIVDKASVKGDSILVGSPLAAREDELLVELPRESMRGDWRVWVKKSELVPEASEARAA